MTVVKTCDSYQGGVKCIRKVCQLMRGEIVMGGYMGVWEGVISLRKCDTPQEV